MYFKIRYCPIAYVAAMLAKIMVLKVGSVGSGVNALSFVIDVSNIMTRMITEVIRNKILLEGKINLLWNKAASYNKLISVTGNYYLLKTQIELFITLIHTD